MKKLSIFKYCISLLLIYLAIIMLAQEQYLLLLRRISSFDLLTCICISFVLILISGVNMNYFINRQYQTKLHLIDIITLPIMMNFWGFIIPVKGGMLYSILFLKAKYKMKMVQGTSMTLFLYTISFTLTGIFGLYVVATHHHYFYLGTFISLLLIMSPLIIMIINYLFQKFHFSNSFIIRKVQALTDSVIAGFSQPWTNIYTILVVGFLIVMRYFLLAVRYYWAAETFNISIPFINIMLLTFTIEFSNIVFRFLPGNIGLSEMITGGLLNILGHDMNDGLLIAVFIRFVTLLLTFTVGPWAVIVNMKHFHAPNLKSLWQTIEAS